MLRFRFVDVNYKVVSACCARVDVSTARSVGLSDAVAVGDCRWITPSYSAAAEAQLNTSRCTRHRATKSYLLQVSASARFFVAKLIPERFSNLRWFCGCSIACCLGQCFFNLFLEMEPF